MALEIVDEARLAAREGHRPRVDVQLERVRPLRGSAASANGSPCTVCAGPMVISPRLSVGIRNGLWLTSPDFSMGSEKLVEVASRIQDETAKLSES